MRRRQFLEATSVAWLAGWSAPSAAQRPGRHVVQMLSDRLGTRVSFSPIGLRIDIGDTVRWVNRVGVHTVTAYHPANDDRPLRMPSGLDAWGSGYLVEPGAYYEHRFDVPGIYDYCCAPHEAAGMVGRLLVGRLDQVAGGDFDGQRPTRASGIPAAARNAFPDARLIESEGIVFHGDVQRGPRPERSGRESSEGKGD